MTEEERIWNCLEIFQNSLVVQFDDKKGVIQISMETEDPKMSAAIVSYIIQELSDYMAEEAKRVALVNKKSLEEQLNSTADPIIRTKIYDMVSKQIEKTVMAEAKENSAFKIIDPPEIPVEEAGPKRTLIVIASFMASLFLGIFIAFAKEFFDKNKSALSKEDTRCS